MGLYARSAAVLVILFGMLFAVLMVAAVYFDLPLILVLMLAVGIVLLQYAIGPPLLDLIFKIHWTDPALVDEELAKFIQNACMHHRLKPPRFGIIEDGNPNAFTYGHYRGDARLVITRGILDLLDEDEREAVVAHEIGHIRNNDFIVMTLAAAVPIALYVLARSMLYGRPAGRRGGGYLLIVAAISFVVYVASHYVARLLSRVREYYADEVSARTTRKPDALSTALIKVAYGLARAPPKAEDWERDRQGMIRHNIGRELGIFDPGMARSMALSASASGQTFSTTAIEQAMYWDLWNPWGLYYEFQSTHPLPAKRIRRLGEVGMDMGRPPKYIFDRPRPESYWDEFIVDWLVGTMPLLLPLAVLLAAFFVLGIHSLPLLVGLGLLFAGFGLLGKTFYQYPRGFRDAEVAGLVKEIKVSPVRAIPVRLRGKIIGRGIPGLFWSEDLVLQDATGFIVMDYHQPLAFLDFLFGIFKAERFVGEEVEAIGWYRRAPRPYLELYQARAVDFRAKCWSYPSKLALGGILTALGIFTVVL